MTFPRCSGCASLFLTFLSFAAQKGPAQNTDAKTLVSVSLQIIGKGTVATFNQDVAGYFTMATVTNQQDTTIVFWIMSCGWPLENWVTSNDSVYRGNFGCDSNIPEDIRFKPHQSIHFYGLLRRSGQKPFCRKVKLGFQYYTRPFDLFHFPNQKIKPAPPTVYWSNEVEIKDNLFQFEID
ncbi:MAG TPA: hypothetical protein VIH61_03980 [Waddliaceae bacterium]